LELNRSDIEQILALIDGAPFDVIHIEWKGLKLTLKKNQDGRFGTDEATAFKAPTEAIPSTLTDTRQQKATEKSLSILEPSVSAADGEFLKEELESGKSFAVKAPTVGIFYSRPEPSAPPFVDLGSKIAEGDTLCLIEVMKVFTAVVAPRSGRVRKILADNNSMVEHNQTLFLIDQNDD